MRHYRRNLPVAVYTPPTTPVLSESARIALLRDQLDQLNEVGNPVQRTNVARSFPRQTINVHQVGGSASAAGGSVGDVTTKAAGGGGAQGGGTPAGSTSPTNSSNASSFWNKLGPRGQAVFKVGFTKVIPILTMVYGTAKIKGAFDRGDYYSVAEYAVGIAGGIAAVLAFFTGGTSAVLAGAAAGLSMTGLAFAIGQVFREDPTIMGQADVSGKTLMELSKMMNDTVIDSNMSNSVKVKVLGGLRDELVKRKVNTPEGYKLLDEIQKKMVELSGGGSQQQTPAPAAQGGGNAPAPAQPAAASAQSGGGNAPTPAPAAPAPSGNAPSPQLDNRGRNPELDSLLQSLGLGGTRR